jgi:hypothetical protein
MTIFQIKELFGFEGGEMARARKAAPPNDMLIAEYAEALAKVALDRAAFDAVYAKLSEDAGLRVGDLIAVAHKYSRGKRCKTRKDALAAIRKRFVELVRLEANRRNAEKARPW